ncbi:hypothetical protein [Arthrobacter sp. MDT1-65]
MKKILAALTFSATLALTACGSSNDAVSSAEPSSEVSSTPISAPSAAPVKTTPSPKKTEDENLSSRGHLIMPSGAFGTISDAYPGDLQAKFSVNSIAPIECTGENAAYYPPENGTMIALDLVVETSPELAQSTNPNFRLSGYDFKYIAENGTTFNGNLSTAATYGCIDDSLIFPSAGMGPNEKVTAKLLLDVPAPTGTLVMLGNNGRGFEYTF